MICIIVPAASRIESTKRRWRLSSVVPASSSAMPSTPFIGVRISWLMLARNWSFARIMDSALSRRSLDVAGALQDLLARREANVAHVALVGGEPVGKRVEIVRESGQLVTAPPGLRRNLFAAGPRRRVACASCASGSTTWRLRRRAASSASTQPKARMNGACRRWRWATRHADGVAISRPSWAGRLAVERNGLGHERQFLAQVCVEPIALVPCHPVPGQGRSGGRRRRRRSGRARSDRRSRAPRPLATATWPQSHSECACTAGENVAAAGLFVVLKNRGRDPGHVGLATGRNSPRSRKTQRRAGRAGSSA